jgi:hypothetical protein
LTSHSLLDKKLDLAQLAGQEKKTKKEKKTLQLSEKEIENSQLVGKTKHTTAC